MPFAISIDWNRTLPVIVSILIIIAIAILRNYSRTLAAIIATMPINVPLGLWIVYAGAEGDQTVMVDFSKGLMLNIIPTLFFLVVTWMALRAGWTLVPVILAGYAAWAVVLGLVFLLRSIFGF